MGLDPLSLALRLPAILLGIGLHEWAHAWTSWKHGDSLPESEGRLSLNPIDHLDPLGTLCIFIAAAPIGWGKAVNVNPAAWRDPLRDGMRVALAGPLMNLAVAAVATLVFVLMVPSLPYDAQWAFNLRTVIWNIIFVNFGLAVFNMLPVPPLDGSKVLKAFARPSVVEFIARLEAAGAGMMIILLLVFSGALRIVFTPVFYLVQLLVLSGTVPAFLFVFAVAATWVLFLRSFP